MSLDSWLYHPVRGGVVAALLAAALPLPGWGQEFGDTVSYLNGGEEVFIGVHLDSVGILPAPGVQETELAAYLAGQGIELQRRLAGGVWVTSHLSGAATSETLVRLGRDLYRDRPELVENAGPLGRFLDSDEPLVLTDQLIVRYHPSVAESRIDSLVAALGAEELQRAPSGSELRLYRPAGSAADVMQVVAAFEASPLTRWAYPDFLGGVRDAAPPPDPLESDQWHLENPGGADINVHGAWTITRGAPGVVIAVLETGGFRADHPDLQPNLWENPGEAGGTPGVDDDGNGYVDDLHGWDFWPCVNNTVPGCGSPDLTSWSQHHGTAVAGLAGADGDNGLGVTGVCPDCRLMLLAAGGGQWSKELAFRYARDHGASVINASWIMTLNTPLDNTIRDVATGAGSSSLGIPVVFAMGKGPEDKCQDTPGSPASFVAMPEVLAVGSSDDSDARVTSTNWGSCMDLMAPGAWGGSDMGVTTTDVQGSGGYHSGGSSACTRAEVPSSEPDHLSYTNCFGGSSASAAIVSGVIGLVRAVHPFLTPGQIREILVETAEKIDCAAAHYGGPGNTACPSDPWQLSETHGYGRVDAGAAVSMAGKKFEEASAVVGAPAGSWELGFRVGWTRLSGTGPTQDVVGAPGSGPGAEPILHLTWLPGPSLMAEVQLGSWTSSQGSTDRSNRVAAVQAAWVLGVASGQVYAGPSFAHQRIDDGTTTLNDHAWGGAVGYRYLLRPYLALRVEGRYRAWSTRSLDEVGLAVGLGVIP